MNAVPIILPYIVRTLVKKKRQATHTRDFFAYGTATMAIGIGHYRHNCIATASKNGSMNSLDIMDERGTRFYGIKSREYPKKTRQVEN